jgi:hypothetical protein
MVGRGGDGCPSGARLFLQIEHAEIEIRLAKLFFSRALALDVAGSGVSLHSSSFALPQWLRPRSNGHKRMPPQNRLRPSPRSRRKICQRAMEEEVNRDIEQTSPNDQADDK